LSAGAVLGAVVPPAVLVVVAVVLVVVAEAVVDSAGVVPEPVDAGGINGNPSPLLNTNIK